MLYFYRSLDKALHGQKSEIDWNEHPLFPVVISQRRRYDMKHSSRYHPLLMVLFVLVTPFVLWYIHLMINAVSPPQGMTGVRDAVMQGSSVLLIRLPKDATGAQEDIVFIDNNPALLQKARTAIRGPAEGTAQSPNEYHRQQLSEDDWTIVEAIIGLWCRQEPSDSTAVSPPSDAPFYEIGVDCGGFTSTHFFVPTHLSLSEIETLINLAPQDVNT